MLKVIITQNGYMEGITILANRNVFNPYFLFLTPKDKEIATLHRYLDNRVKISKSEANTCLPDYTAKCLLLGLTFQRGVAFSYPEAGVIPNWCSILADVFVQMAHDKGEGDVTVYTVSEYLVRKLQILVAYAHSRPDMVTQHPWLAALQTEGFLSIYQLDEKDPKPFPLNFQIPDELTVSGYAPPTRQAA